MAAGVIMILRLVLVAFLIFTVWVVNALANPIPFRLPFDKAQDRSGSSTSMTDKNVQYGTSYSFEQAGWYGLDPRESYIELLDQFRFDWVRLAFFWDQTLLRSDGSTEGRVVDDPHLADLKFAIEEAQKRDIKVIIALGAKTPYFPEYHLPKEIADQIEFGQRIGLDHPIADDLLAIDRKVVEALAPYGNIIAWQVENEPLVGNVNRWKLDPALIAAEVEIVRQTDPAARPIILNHAAVGFYDQSWQNLLSILAPGDIFALNAFFKTKGTDLFNAKVFGREIHILWPDHFVWPVHSWGFLSPDFELIKKIVEGRGQKFWILEMQAEPYIKKLDEARDPFLPFTPADIEAADNFLKSYKIESVGLWGAHFWQYRAKLGDKTWSDAVKSVTEN